ncbi:MAG: HNH endonuclease signature motif containing protein [Cyanobacteria bacterium P01_F01_bin.116]
MRIALRTGGGRGVYELAGTQGSYRASDLFDREMFYELTPKLIIPGRAVPSSRQGKPRIKLNNQSDTTHFYRLLSGLLLLPKPKREFKTTSGSVLIAFEAYSMTAIKIDVSAVEDSRIIVRPKEILLENFQGLRKSISFIDRMARIMDLWQVASEQDSALANLLRLHQETLYTDHVNHKSVEKAAKNIFTYIETIYDPLDKIETDMGITQFSEPEETPLIPDTQEFGVTDTTSQTAARIESVRKWRKVSVRGSAASRFRSVVRELYEDTCLFTGQRLPKLSVTASAGVDAAHILPWASHGVNTVDNGICLNKQCHWAFDSGVLKFSFDGATNQYIISIPDEVLTEASVHDFSLDTFQRMEGPIPLERLPDNPENWPSPSYLEGFNKIMFA